ncbi:MAG TPA: hypothetical protein VMQ76_03445 [Terracidiphilus sp.]|nr:hypothetical protein [Terracidiphilus sp.]
MATKRKNGLFTKSETYRVTRAPGRSNETSYKGARVWQTWPEGFKTSLDPDSTFDSLKDVKRFIDWQKKNPGKGAAAFKRCNAVAGRKRAARGNPKEKSAAYEAGRKALASAASKLGTVNLTPSIAQREDWRHAWKEFMAGWNAEKRRPNPSDAAADVYEEFHGRPSEEVVTVTEKIHYHEHLAALGELRTLVVQARDGGKVTLSRFKKAILCCNEAKTQMFIRGGDQAVDLEAFGIRTVHEVETLGRVVELAYFTRKDHLGDEGGTAVYFHVSGETIENGKYKMAGWGPDLIYHTVDERLEFSGGSYTIRAEGVDK